MDIDHLSPTENELLKPNRKDVIFSKGFDMINGGRNIKYRTVTNEFKKIKVGVKNLDDATVDLGALKKILPRSPFFNKGELMKAVMTNDYKKLREFSRFFYKTNGIYAKLC